MFGFDIDDSVQMIGYNKVTSATAFFESADNGEWTHVDPVTNRLVGKLPGINDPEDFDPSPATTDLRVPGEPGPSP